MRYAIIRIGGKQYRVEEGDTIDIEKLDVGEGEDYIIEDVLLVVGKGRLDLGKPIVKKAKVKAKVISQFKGEKIRVARFRRRKRYSKVKGHRQNLTRLKITKITTENKNNSY